MSIVLGKNQYGKAENRVVRIYRDTERHEIKDVNVSSSLRGDFTVAQVFADLESLALQQTLFEMGKAVLEEHPEIDQVKFSAPNKHHFLYDLETFGMENNNEVFHADDRPYGLIEATVERDDAGDPGRAWDTVPAFA